MRSPPQHTSLCVLCASKVCRFRDEEIAGQLWEVFAGILRVLHSDSARILPRPGTPESDGIQRAHPDLRR